MWYAACFGAGILTGLGLGFLWLRWQLRPFRR